MAEESIQPIDWWRNRIGKEESFDCRYCEETLYNISLRMGTQGSTRVLPHSGWRVLFPLQRTFRLNGTEQDGNIAQEKRCIVLSDQKPPGQEMN